MLNDILLRSNVRPLKKMDVIGSVRHPPKIIEYTVLSFFLLQYIKAILNDKTRWPK